MLVGKLLLIEEVALIARRSHWTIRRDVAAGKLRAIRMGSRLVFEETEIERYIEAAKQRTDHRPIATGGAQ